MDWLGLHIINPQNWPNQSLNEWWLRMTGSPSTYRKAIGSFTMLISWEIWNENARIFQNKHASSMVIVDKIKKEARLWVTAGAKCLSELIPGE
jgi:hypothetical protein